MSDWDFRDQDGNRLWWIPEYGELYVSPKPSWWRRLIRRLRYGGLQ